MKQPYIDFGVVQNEVGVCYTRTGRRFFNDEALEQDFLHRILGAAFAPGLFDELATDWLCLDCELMPWSVKRRTCFGSSTPRPGPLSVRIGRCLIVFRGCEGPPT